MVGGDGFLEMAVEPGHEVVVEGYDGEPYLRFRADGTVQENQNSPATYLNRNRYAGAEVPAAIQGDDRPAAGLEDRRPRTAITPGTTTASTSWARTPRSSPACPRAGRSSGAAGCPSPSTATTVVGQRQLPAARPAEPVALDRPDRRGHRRDRRRRPAPAGARGRRGPAGGRRGRARRGLGAERRHPPGGGGHAAHRGAARGGDRDRAASPSRGPPRRPASSPRSRRPRPPAGGCSPATRCSRRRSSPPTSRPGLDRAGTALALATAIGGAVLAVRSGGLSLPRLEPAAAGPGPAAYSQPARLSVRCTAKAAPTIVASASG